MQAHGWLSEADFTRAVEALPLVSVDWIVLNPAGQMLLGLRRRTPARDWWFTPGGRVRKNEALPDALARVGRDELGLPEDLVAGARLLGAWDHFYPDSGYSDVVSTHYVNLPHLVRLDHSPDPDTLPTDQHRQWRWQNAAEAAVADDVHPYARVSAQIVADLQPG
ncbi:NUDIX domain-containing protein [Mycolicibacterium sp.]|uniref:NUDIX domain-containing protein n=1 Tax=Mycolicibacterium sp. TaxID=2320850 RepID=UPI001D57CFEC|nr:NUDIX domain-containing protein [Mycolicibacterium sp.]MCB1286515.1 NUDIX domain-containing protein [Mycobacterium sp.]MCB9409973.1 NUDIX domain-containing protein [Mycolicibacterium sp.]